jgi:O-antigen/teichoic acid export membrane protein
MAKGLHTKFKTLVMLGLRASGLFAKFALTLFIAKFMGLEALGLYGLIAVGGTLVPALFGLGLNGPASRSAVGAASELAIRIATSRLAVTALLHLVFAPLAVAVALYALPEQYNAIVVLVAVTLFLENLACDVHSLLLARFRSTLAAVLLFVRSGAWPFFFIAAAWYHPALRNVETIMAFWLASLVLLFAGVLLLASTCRYWRWARFDGGLIKAFFRRSTNFYLADIGQTGLLYLDRFLVGSFLGLEATGVYTFFWSLTNAVNSLILNAVTTPLAPTVISAVKQGHKPAILQAFRVIIKEVTLWCLGLSLALACVMPVILAMLGNSKISEHKLVFAAMLIATALRTVSEAADSVLYAYHADHKIALISLCAVVVSALCICALAPWLGLLGVAIATCFVALFIFAWRGYTARSLLANPTSIKMA